MTEAFRKTELEAYLDEALPAERMARIEKALRGSPALVERLATIHAERNAGSISLGRLWREHRLSCPTREQWGSFLLGAISAEATRYMTFHVEVVGCRYCQANLADLKNQQTEQPDIASTRRRRYFQTSAGHLRGRSGDP